MASERAGHWPLWNVTTRTHCMPVVFIAPWLLSVTRVAVSLTCRLSSLCSPFSCYYVSSFTAERHVLLVLALPTSARDAGLREQHWEGRPLLTAAPAWHWEAQLLLLAVFPLWCQASLRGCGCTFSEYSNLRLLWATSDQQEEKFWKNKKTSCFIGQPHPG